jgi:hypothetical protein
VGKRNASKYIELVQNNYARSFVGRKPKKPVGPPFWQADGWAAYQHPFTHKDNRLWVPVKVVHVAALEGPKRRGIRRTFWLYFGFDAKRFRRSKDRRLFQEQAPPAVYEAVLAACCARYMIAAYEKCFGAADLAAQRAKLAASTAKRERLTAERLERDYVAALAEDAKRSKS